MTLKEAIAFYLKAKGIAADNNIYHEDNIKHLQRSTVDAIYAIKDAGDMVERMGGKLTSRQTIAAIIIAAELKNEQ